MPATRSPGATMKLTEATAPPITPLDTTGLEAVGSVLVCTVMESVAALATPMVQPTSVTVTAVPAVSVAAKTMDVAPGCAGVRMASDVDDVAVGVGEVAKKPAG